MTNGTRLARLSPKILFAGLLLAALGAGGFAEELPPEPVSPRAKGLLENLSNAREKEDRERALNSIEGDFLRWPSLGFTKRDREAVAGALAEIIHNPDGDEGTRLHAEKVAAFVHLEGLIAAAKDQNPAVRNRAGEEVIDWIALCGGEMGKEICKEGIKRLEREGEPFYVRRENGKVVRVGVYEYDRAGNLSGTRAFDYPLRSEPPRLVLPEAKDPPAVGTTREALEKAARGAGEAVPDALPPTPDAGGQGVGGTESRTPPGSSTPETPTWATSEKNLPDNPKKGGCAHGVCRGGDSGGPTLGGEGGKAPAEMPKEGSNMTGGSGGGDTTHAASGGGLKTKEIPAPAFGSSSGEEKKKEKASEKKEKTHGSGNSDSPGQGNLGYP